MAGHLSVKEPFYEDSASLPAELGAFPFVLNDRELAHNCCSEPRHNF